MIIVTPRGKQNLRNTNASHKYHRVDKKREIRSYNVTWRLWREGGYMEIMEGGEVGRGRERGRDCSEILLSKDAKQRPKQISSCSDVNKNDTS